MIEVDVTNLAVILTASAAILLLAFLTAISAKDVIRLLISLELMFAAVFLAIVPLFSINPPMAYAVAIITAFTSSTELLVLVTAIILLDRRKRGVEIEKVAVGGENL